MTALSRQSHRFHYLQSQAYGNNTGGGEDFGGYDGAIMLGISNGAGTCTVTLQGSFDNFATPQSAQDVGVILASTNAAGTPACNTSRTLANGVIAVAANTSYSYQVNDMYPYYRAVISSASGLGVGTDCTGCTVLMYANPT